MNDMDSTSQATRARARGGLSGWQTGSTRVSRVALLGCVVCVVGCILLTSAHVRGGGLSASPAGASSAVERLPVELRAAASSAIGASLRRYWVSGRGGSLVAAGGGISTTFAASGLHLLVAGKTFGLTLAGVGRGDRVAPVAVVEPTRRRSAVFYRRGSLTEWYRNGPFGLEQGFTLRHRPPAGTGSLVLALRLGDTLTPKQVGSQILLRTNAGATALRYGQLSAVDATGRRLSAQVQIRDRSLQVVINDSHARYPLRIDPLIQQGASLTGTEDTTGSFGSSVAISADGSTALVGGSLYAGAAWVFTRANGVWVQQGSKLTPNDETGAGNFGESVALSSDGNTALIGGPSEDAAWVFTRSGGVWTQQGSKLTSSDATACCGPHFGTSVALSSDGNTALIGGPYDNSYGGAAWVFARSGSTWTQQGSKLTATDETGHSEFGGAVALSADGNTALIGGAADNYDFGGSPSGAIGAAWVFTRSGSTWTQQGAKLTGSGETGDGSFGSSVALSSDGNTALIGGPRDHFQPSPVFYIGAAWVFTRSGSTWTQQGAKLTANDESGGAYFGAGVALSSDGNTALVDGPRDNNAAGAAWLFTRSGSTWSQQGAKLAVGGTSGSPLAGSVALSSNATTLMVGGAGPNASSAWVFAELPVASGVSPAVGPPGGGTSVTISGSGFAGVTAVKFGSAAASFTVDSPTQITATSPPGSLGPVDVTLTNAQGTSPTSNADTFAYAIAPAAPLEVSAASGSRQATVSFTAPSANGSPITSYTVTASPGGAQTSGASSPITINGLSDWTSYTFTVSATNAAGTGPPSAPSGGVMTPAQSTTTITPSTNTSFYGTELGFTATVASVPPAAPIPSGTVQFEVTGESPVPIALDPSGHAVFHPAYFLNLGDTVTAKYGGDANHAASSVVMTPNIEPAVTVTSVTASPNPASPGGAVTFNATVTNTSTSVVPFGSVQFVIDGEPVLGSLALNNSGEAGIEAEGALAAGDHVVQAFYHDGTGVTPNFTDSHASVTEHITSPPPPAKSPASPPPPPPPFQATLSVFPLAPTVRGLLRGAFSDSVTLTGPGSVSENMFADNGVLPATASRASSAHHKKGKRHQVALLLARGSASTATAGTVNVTLLPTAAGKKTLKKTRHSLRVVLITSVKDAKTGNVTNLPAKTLTLKH
jgi:IPT/TIG domain/Bacterial Ig-like domain (group 3)/Fibronectin type III domain/FG-GAP repeat